MLPTHIDALLAAALAEDMPYGDVTTEALFPPDATAAAVWTAKAAGVVCGVALALRTFTLLDPSLQTEALLPDGARVRPGDVIARLRGSARALLMGERTALNLLQHLSGIATATAHAVDCVAGTRCRVTDTRKTLPGLRALQKYAVTVGGGFNHRQNLSDGAMLKDNHIDAGGGIPAAVAAVRARIGHMVKLEVEARTLSEVEQALAAGAEVIMLDNMSAREMTAAVKLVNGRALLEASGNMTPERLREVAATGVDLISMGALTHSVCALDVSMKMTEKGN